MNLKGSHLLQLVVILFCNYLMYISNFPLWTYIIEYVIIFFIGINFVATNRKNLDFRMYDDPDSAKSDRDYYISYERDESPWNKNTFGHRTFNPIKALKYSGDIYYIITVLPVLPFIGFHKFMKYLDENLSLKA
jgi:hypothetical protein